MDRPFRSDQSYQDERLTRELLKPFLEARGFRKVDDTRKQYGKNQKQVIVCLDEAATPVKLWVRLCWHHRTGDEAYSAAQLLSTIKDGDWLGTLLALQQREASTGVTHLVLVQASNRGIENAAQIPIDSLTDIWTKQRDISQALIDAGRLKRKNHAMNGVSPSLWLRSDMAPEVGSALWDFPGGA